MLYSGMFLQFYFFSGLPDSDRLALCYLKFKDPHIDSYELQIFSRVFNFAVSKLTAKNAKIKTLKISC